MSFELIVASENSAAMINLSSVAYRSLLKQSEG